MANDLEKDFNKTKADIKVLLQTAADLIKQATNLAVKSKLPHTDREDNLDDEDQWLGSYNFYEETRPLMNAISDAGWSASSLRC